MMKWLRAHTKQIMVFTVLMAMFSFVGGSALVQILAPSQDKDPIFKAFGREVLLRDFRPAQRDTDILEKLGLGWKYDQPDRHMTHEHWYILTDEAQRAGIVVSDQEIEQEIQQIQQMRKMMGDTSDILDLMRVAQHVTPPEVRRAIRGHLMIMKHAQFLGASAAPSEAQVKHYIRDTLDKVKVQLVALDAEKFMDANLPLSAEQLQTQFDKYKDVNRSTSDTGYGYKYPRRVKIQYAVANVKKIEPQLAVGFDEVKNYWKANKSKYRKVVYEDAPPASQPAQSQPTSSPTSQPKPAPIAKSVEKTLAEAIPDIERDLRKKNAQRLSEQALAKLATVLQKPWLEEKTNADTGYKQIPTTVKAPEFLKNAAEHIAKEFGIQIDFKETGLVSADELDKADDLRNANVAGEGGAGMKLSEYAFRIPEFYKHEKGESGSDAAMSLQLFQTPDAPLTASDLGIFVQRMTPPKDRLIVFRVIESSEAKAPATVDEVRALVEKDLRMAAAMKSMEPQVKELCAAAKHVGLKDAWALFADLQSKTALKEPVTPVPFSRLVRKNDPKMRDVIASGESTLAPPDVTGIGASQAFADACCQMASDDWVSPIVEATGEKLKSALAKPAAKPIPAVQMIALPTLGKWCVVEKLGVERVDEGKYESELREQNFSRLLGERGAYLLAQWFKPESIEKRSGFERIQRAAAPETREGIRSEPRTDPLLDFQ